MTLDNPPRGKPIENESVYMWCLKHGIQQANKYNGTSTSSKLLLIFARSFQEECVQASAPSPLLPLPHNWCALDPPLVVWETLAYNSLFECCLKCPPIRSAIAQELLVPAKLTPSSKSAPYTKQEPTPQNNKALSLLVPSMKDGVQAFLSQCFHSLLNAPLQTLQVNR